MDTGTMSLMPSGFASSDAERYRRDLFFLLFLLLLLLSLVAMELTPAREDERQRRAQIDVEAGRV